MREQRAPFVPELDGETDAGYFDDFSNEADMAKYKEVRDKQAALENMADRDEQMGKGLFVGFTFRYVALTFTTTNSILAQRYRHRKPTVDANGQKGSPRKALPTDGSFGTIF